jgi:hypothetical protein
MLKTIECLSCTAEFSVVFETDHDEQDIAYCPVCSEPIVLEDVLDEEPEDY